MKPVGQPKPLSPSEAVAKTTSAVAFVIWVVQDNETIRVTPTHLAMKTTLRIALICLASLVLPCAHAQQSEALRKEFLEYKAKAEKGDANAQSNLGGCYYHGRGVEKDYAEAVKWFRKAAEQNFAEAQYNLGFCYYHGEGVEKDYAEAYAWFNLASKTDKEAAKYRDLLEKKMSPQQVADAQKRTKELRAQIEAQLKSGGK